MFPSERLSLWKQIRVINIFRPAERRFANLLTIRAARHVLRARARGASGVPATPSFQTTLTRDLAAKLRQRGDAAPWKGARPVAVLPPCLLAKRDSAACLEFIPSRSEVPFETFSLVSKLHRQRVGVCDKVLFASALWGPKTDVSTRRPRGLTRTH